MEIKDWVRAARARKGLSQETLAEMVGRSKAAIGHWETGRYTPSFEQIGQISAATGYPAPPLGASTTPAARSNVEAAPDHKGLVPLISWVRAGEWHPAADPLQPGEAERWLPCLAGHSASTYALRVKGDSMTAPQGNVRTYPEGSFIFVDPERRSPVNGDRIIAKLEGEDEVTFKVYKNEDGRQWLLPLNPTHEPIRQPFRVLGTVIGKWEDG